MYISFSNYIFLILTIPKVVGFVFRFLLSLQTSAASVSPPPPPPGSQGECVSCEETSLRTIRQSEVEMET